MQKTYKSAYIIVSNRSVGQNFFIEEKFKAGIVLLGWEVRALRNKKVNIKDSYITSKNNELWLLGSHFASENISDHFEKYDPRRVRKLLVTKHEILKISNYIVRQGYTVLPIQLYWKNSWCKVEFAIAKGKKQHDKRRSIKEREWKISKMRVLKKKYP